MRLIEMHSHTAGLLTVIGDVIHPVAAPDKKRPTKINPLKTAGFPVYGESTIRPHPTKFGTPDSISDIFRPIQSDTRPPMGLPRRAPSGTKACEQVIACRCNVIGFHTARSSPLY